MKLQVFDNGISKFVYHHGSITASHKDVIELIRDYCSKNGHDINKIECELARWVA